MRVGEVRDDYAVFQRHRRDGDLAAELLTPGRCRGHVVHLNPGTARAIGRMLMGLADDIETAERDAGLLEAFG